MEDESIEQFNKNELLSVLQKNECHSPELLESEDESGVKTSGKNFIHVYDHPWRSYTVNITYYYFGNNYYSVYFYHFIF